jgi:nitrate reductase assembly molybdenum cofactor insertion protein NarJ
MEFKSTSAGSRVAPEGASATGRFDHYARLAVLFEYPDEYLAGKADEVADSTRERYPEAAEGLSEFADYVNQNDIYDLEEIFLRSFDVQAITTLDIGYVLFGDDYKRGAVLVNLNREHRQVGNPCYSELADHLPNILRLIPLLEDDDFRVELVDRLVAPALRKIIREFSPGKIEAKQRVYRKHHKTLIDASEQFRTIYRQPLEALYAIIEADFELSEEAPPEASSDFLKKIGTEITLETESETPTITQSCSL